MPRIGRHSRNLPQQERQRRIPGLTLDVAFPDRETFYKVQASGARCTNDST